MEFFVFCGLAVNCMVILAADTRGRLPVGQENRNRRTALVLLVIFATSMYFYILFDFMTMNECCCTQPVDEKFASISNFSDSY